MALLFNGFGELGKSMTTISQMMIIMKDSMSSMFTQCPNELLQSKHALEGLTYR